ncbi:MAG: hypothetical protein Q8Q06_04085 [bacterium]|nr:hypothetical protein [bacterium]
MEYKEKPEFLYHGSPHRGIEELEPRAKSHRDPAEGAQVFATQEMGLAAIFMTEKVAESGLHDRIPYAIIAEPREDFIKNDKGGHIYVLPSDGFVCDPEKGLREYEWTSKSPVRPVKTMEYNSALDAMIENGVQVYFIEPKTLQEIRQAKDMGLSILQRLESENQKRGVSIEELR